MLVPLAVVGLAVAMPVAPLSAGHVVDHTVRRAESFSDQLTQTARQLCSIDSVVPAARLKREAFAASPAPMVVDVTDRAASLPTAAPHLPTLIDLPPPADC